MVICHSLRALDVGVSSGVQGHALLQKFWNLVPLRAKIRVFDPRTQTSWNFGFFTRWQYMNTEFKLRTSFQRKVSNECTWNNWWISLATGSNWKPCYLNIDNNVMWAMLGKSSTLMYSRLLTTQALGNSNLLLAQTNIDFSWISFIHLQQFYPRWSNPR